MADDPDIDLILSFWFHSSLPRSRWFIESTKFDAEIRENFGQLIALARTTECLDQWVQSARGSLTLLLLLDQFPRNVFRNRPEAFSSDQKALTIASQAIAKGFDRQIPLMQQTFFYLPFEHQEQLICQDTCVNLFEGLVGRCEVGSEERDFADQELDCAIRHRYVIARFGRFPTRNLALHRHSTAEELEYVKKHPLGY